MTRVSLCACPAIMPFSFALHLWFVVETNESTWRFEMGWNRNKIEKELGYLYINDLPPMSGTRIFPFSQYPVWKSRRIGFVEGVLAEQMAALFLRARKLISGKINIICVSKTAIPISSGY